MIGITENVRSFDNTHSWYTAGVFVKNRRENKSLNKFWSWVEER